MEIQFIEYYMTLNFFRAEGVNLTYNMVSLRSVVNHGFTANLS